MSEKPVLLLTATIHPDPYVTSGRLDPLEREEDYFKATEYYLKIGYKVVFIENSNTKSQKIFDLGRLFPGLEYLFFASQESHLGKSKGEVEIMNFALSQSVLLSKVDYVIKITGRYLISNLDQVVLPTNCIEKDIYINPTRNLRWADSRLMMMKKSYYFEYFLPTVLKYLDEEKKVYMENVFIKSLFYYLIDGGTLNLWPAYPAYQGFDGTHNEQISFSFIKMLRYNIYYRIKKFVFKHRA
jgi:hypothetical protein